MAKETITEYESAEQSVTKIRCDSCGNVEWDGPSDDGINLLVLDCVTQSYRHGYSAEWRGRDFSTRSLRTTKPCRITGEATAHFCDSCNMSLGDDKHMIQVEEKDYYVEKKTRDRYFCDLCDESMDDEADHEVSVNPQIIELSQTIEFSPEKKQRVRSNKETVLTQMFEERVTSSRHDSRLDVKRDDSFDCCHSCANELFDLPDVYGNQENWFSVLKSALFGL